MPAGDAFAQMEQLARLTKLEAPAALSSLQGLPVLHRDVIDRADIADYVKAKLPQL